MKDAILENDLEQMRSLIQQNPHCVNGSLTEQGCNVDLIPYQLMFMIRIYCCDDCLIYWKSCDLKGIS